MAKTLLRKNSRAKSWTSKKISLLVREGVPHRQAVATAISMAKRHGLVHNPEEESELAEELGTEEEAEEVARGFHGRENQETIEIDEPEVFRENLALLGEMVELEVFIEARQDEGLIPIKFSGETGYENKEDAIYLSCSSDRKQLYINGNCDLPDDWLEETSPSSYEKDLVPIGYVYSISYFADKHHLTGSKQQKNGTPYIHCFGEQTFKHKGNANKIFALEDKILAGLLPMLIYNRLNQGMELVGGGYSVKDEGIWD